MISEKRRTNGVSPTINPALRLGTIPQLWLGELDILTEPSGIIELKLQRSEFKAFKMAGTPSKRRELPRGEPMRSMWRSSMDP